MSKTKIYYCVEAKFNERKGWQRNFQEHESLDRAKSMARHFFKMAEVRIIRIEIIETECAL